MIPANWKPMLVGVITAIAAFVDFDPTLFGKHPWLMSVSKFIMIGGFAAFGIVAKSKDVTGGTKPNDVGGPPPPKP